MKLDEFITNVLTDIDNGLRVAKEKGNRNYYVSSTDKGGVSFDIAVTTINTNGQTAEGKAKVGFIAVLGAGVGGRLEKTSEHSEASRIQFSVYVPSQTKTESEEQSRRIAETNRNNDIGFGI